MISWYRQQAKEHGLLPATRWLGQVLWAMSVAVLSNRLLPPRLVCPCCGWEGRRFLDYIEVGYRVDNAACPRCDSHSRHRALYLWLKNEFQVANSSGRALVFAPEKSLAPLWQSAQNLEVHRIDIVPARGVSLLVDVMSLPFVANSIDLIWCHHVLEQVEDDNVALAELCRVLRPHKGVLVLSVGMSNAEFTSDFGFADKALTGNRRIYGADVMARIQAADFKVKPMTSNLSEQERSLYGILPEVFFYCTKDDLDVEVVRN